MIGISFLLFIVGIPNISSGLGILSLLETAQVDSSMVLRSVLISIGFGFALCAVGAVLLFKSNSAAKMIQPKNENWMLACVAAFLIVLPWLEGFDLGFNNEVVVDGITFSALIVMTITLIFSLISWSLFSWASRTFRFTGILLALISGASLIIPFIQILGPMAAILVGVVGGFAALMIQKIIFYPGNNRPILISFLTLLAAYIALGTLIAMSQSPHIWDTGNGIGSWSGTPEGMEEYSLRNTVIDDIRIAYFVAIIPSLMITVMTIQRKNEN